MRIIEINNIDREKKTNCEANDNYNIAHGGVWPFEIEQHCLSEYGFEVFDYYNGFPFENDDIVLLVDRTPTHMYKAWKMLKKQGMLKRTISIMIESPVVDRKCGEFVLNKIKNAFPFFLTYQDNLVDNKKFFKLWPVINITDKKVNLKYYKNEDIACAMICSRQILAEEKGELYSKRIEIVDWFENNPDKKFRIYGKGWNGYSNWGGVIRCKEEAYNNAKYAFCIENARRNGYITEKIFDCFQEGIVPIYLGAPNVESYIPESCYIDLSKFETLDSLWNYLGTISEAEYKNMISEIKKFLENEADKFSPKLKYDQISTISNLKYDFNITPLAYFRMYKYVWVYERNKIYGSLLGYLWALIKYKSNGK